MIRPGDVVRDAGTGVIGAVHHLHTVSDADVAYVVPLAPGQPFYACIGDLRRIGHIDGYGADEIDDDEVVEVYVDALEVGAGVGLFLVETDE